MSVVQPAERLVGVDASGSAVVVATTTRTRSFDSLDDAMGFAQGVLKAWHTYQRLMGNHLDVTI